MTQQSLFQTQVVLPLYMEGEQQVVFRFVDDPEDVASGVVVRLSREIFEDFGSPAQITVTVVPGDELNQ